MADLQGSSYKVNEFNRFDQELEGEEDQRGLIHHESTSNKVSVWTVYLCPVIYLLVVFILSICLISASSISQYQLTRDSIDTLQNFYNNQDLLPIKNIQFVVANTAADTVTTAPATTTPATSTASTPPSTSSTANSASISGKTTHAKTRKNKDKVSHKADQGTAGTTGTVAAGTATPGTAAPGTTSSAGTTTVGAGTTNAGAGTTTASTTSTTAGTSGTTTPAGTTAAGTTGTTTATATTNKVTCPTNYAQYNFYDFPGVDSGCLCNDGTTHSTAYCLVVTSNGCQKVNSIAQKDLYEFSDTLICVERFAAADIQVLTSTGKCNTGYTSCPSNYCVKTGSVCPITSLSTTNTNSVTETTTLGSTTYYISRNVAAEALVNVESTISNPSCLNPNVYPKTLSGKYYPFWMTPLTGCDQFGDSTNWTNTLSTETETSFWADNGEWTALSKEPYINVYTNTSDLYVLRTVSRIPSGRSQTCESLKTKLSFISDGAEDAIEHIIDYSIANLILSLIGILMCLCYYCCKNLKLCKKLVCQNHSVPYMILLLCFVVFLLCIIMAADYWNNETLINDDNDADNTIQQSITQNCFSQSSGLQLALNTLKTYLGLADSWVFGATVFLFVWSILAAVVFAVCYIIRKFYLRDVVMRRP